MHTEANITIETREELGSLASRRLRRVGRVPGNMYGHNQEPVTFHAPAAELKDILRHKVRIVNVKHGEKEDKCMLQEVQWDTFGMHLMHVDFLRIDPDERVTVEVPIELRGNAPGVQRGGILETNLRSVTISCLAYMVPDNITVRIGGLDIDQAIHVKELEIPEGMVCENGPDTIVVKVAHVDASKAAATTPTEGGAVQPEVIGKKPSEDGAADAKGADKGKGKK